MDIPRWIKESEECLFCHKYVPVNDIKVSEDEKYLIVIYECDNDKCYSKPKLGKTAELKMKYDHPGFVLRYKEGLSKGWGKKEKAEA